MKAQACFICLLAPLATAAEGIAQPPEAARPAIRLHRFDEDWRPLCRAAAPKKPVDHLKCQTLAPGLTLTLGGEWRERLELATDPGFGLRQESESALLHRLLLHADVRKGEHLRAFVQLGYYEQTGRNGRVPPTDVDRLDMTQAFVDLSARLGAGHATVRVGRQELSFGSSRLVAVRDGPNARRSFDGGRVFLTAGDSRVDVFAVRPVDVRRGTFDDATDDAEAFWGAYGSTAAALGKPLKVDVYYLGYKRSEGLFAQGAGQERRHTLGTRIFGKSKGFDWDLEAAIQFGRFAGGIVRAWTVASDFGYTFAHLPLSPRLGLKADIASGDRSAADRRLGSFNALSPKLPYFSEANLVAPTNLIDLQPSVALAPIRALSVKLGWDAIWRHRVTDAIYTTPLLPVPLTSGRGGRFTGHQSILGFEWRSLPGLTLSGEYVHFEPGRALREADGKPVNFLMLAAGWRF